MSNIFSEISDSFLSVFPPFHQLLFLRKFLFFLNLKYILFLPQLRFYFTPLLRVSSFLDSPFSDSTVSNPPFPDSYFRFIACEYSPPFRILTLSGSSSCMSVALLNDSPPCTIQSDPWRLLLIALTSQCSNVRFWLAILLVPTIPSSPYKPTSLFRRLTVPPKHLIQCCFQPVAPISKLQCSHPTMQCISIELGRQVDVMVRLISLWVS